MQLERPLEILTIMRLCSLLTRKLREAITTMPLTVLTQKLAKILETQMTPLPLRTILRHQVAMVNLSLAQLRLEKRKRRMMQTLGAIQTLQIQSMKLVKTRQLLIAAVVMASKIRPMLMLVMALVKRQRHQATKVTAKQETLAVERA